MKPIIKKMMTEQKAMKAAANKIMSSQQETPEATPEKKQLKKPVEKKSLPVDSVKYDKYTELKLLDLAEAKLTAETKSLIIDLETDLKKCSGSKPIRTVTAAIGNEKVHLIEGVPVTKEIENLIKKEGSTEYYFGK